MDRYSMFVCLKTQYYCHVKLSQIDPLAVPFRLETLRQNLITKPWVRLLYLFLYFVLFWICWGPYSSGKVRLIENPFLKWNITSWFLHQPAKLSATPTYSFPQRAEFPRLLSFSFPNLVYSHSFLLVHSSLVLSSGSCPAHNNNRLYFGSNELVLPILTKISIGLAKKCLQFLSKNKRHIFHFHQELYWTTYSHICSTTFCHFSGNFIIPSSQNFLSFWAKNCSRCLL